MELCLGTVQFGMNYGIRGQRKPSAEDAVSLMDYAVQNGVRALDTARAYGTAEELVGQFLKKKTVPRESLFISTKLRPNLLDDAAPGDYAAVVEREITSQLKRLNTNYVDAYVYHSAGYAFDEAKLAALRGAAEKGYARKTGVSVYEPEEAGACCRSGLVDFLQVPYSIFDQRMKKSGVFDAAAGCGCEIHTRSAFLQGLIVMDEEQVPPFLSRAKAIVRKIRELSEEAEISRVQLALQYVKRETAVSHLVFGVDSPEQLKEDIAHFQEELPPELLKQMGEAFADLEADLVMPSLWKR